MENIEPENITHYHIFNTNFNPLSYADLISVAVRKENTLNITFDGAMTEDLAIQPSAFKSVKGDFTITFNEDIQIFSLVEGGWLPLPFVNPPHFLVDSNVVINLEKIKKKLLESKATYAWWWLQLLDSPDVTVNPILYAFEGKGMKIPKLNEFIDYLEDALKTIRKVLPNARVTAFNPENYREVYKIIKNTIERREKQTEFLLKINNFLLNHISSQDLLKVESEILNIAKLLKINLMSIVVLVCLSCLYEKNDNKSYQAARKILKFSPNFNESKAFNALCDLAAIELFASSGAISNTVKIPKFAFCTSDKATAIFCCGLNLKDRIISEKGLTFNVSITKELFPILSDNARLELTNRIFGS